MEIYWIVSIVVVTFAFMEFTAWFTHKYVMHGFLWVLHKDHHTREHEPFEWNDVFALIFALPSALLIYFGAKNGNDFSFWVGIGIALYGLAYFLYHDVLIHKRLKMFSEPRRRYFKAIVKAHYDHHRGRKNYGFLFMVPFKYLKEEYGRNKNN